MSTVLVVDDSLTDRCRAAGLLRHAGFEARTAEDGQAALDAIAAETPDAIVTDLQMPRTDGFALLTEVVRSYPFVPIVVITSQGSEATAVRALQAGAASYVPKRDLATHLPEAVRRVCILAGEDRNLARLTDRLLQQHLKYRIETDLELISPAVRSVRELLKHASWMDDGMAMRTALAFEEALLNAVYHGNLELDSSLREGDSNIYYDLAKQRSTLPEYRDRVIVIEIAISRQEVRFQLTDQGRGFDPDALPDPTDPDNIARASGRGLLLIHTFMDDVSHDYGGTQITMTKRLAEPARETNPKRAPRKPGNCKGMIQLLVEDDEHLKDFKEYMP